MKIETVRDFVLSLPEVTAQPHFELLSFRVRGKIVATVPEDGEHLHIFVNESETRAAVKGDPAAFEELWWGKRLSGVRVNLHAAREQGVLDLILKAWRGKAPRPLVDQFDAERGTS